ncbi:MAG TPA: tail fiber protein [Bacteroidia bacterium]|nr:tail fiber protein [Bacteroidia bacterium]
MDPVLGEIRAFAGTFAPRGWHFCDGSSLPISQYDTMYALLGTTYGGDGVQTFNLPDLRGRRAIHAGQGPGLPMHTLGEMAGVEGRTITPAQMPAHTHVVSADVSLTTTWQCVNADATPDLGPQGAFYAIASEADYATETDSNFGPPLINTNFSSMRLAGVGGSQPIDIRTPFMAINYIICMEGIFPTRN